MVLDIDAFRAEKGGNPDKVRENQRKRFKDVAMVDKVMETDENWRKGICICCFDFFLLFQRGTYTSTYS